MTIVRREFLFLAAGAAILPAVRSAEQSAHLEQMSLEGRLSRDPRRPQIHLLPAANWMNDPNGPIYWNGSYHMFYQYNPHGAYWGDMHWGHAISKDMVHWKHLPMALAPTPGGPDADGCFTGAATVQDGRVVLMYTGVHAAPEDQATIKDGVHSLREKQCLAISADPGLITWKKVAEPVIAAPPPALNVNGFRDPSPWRQGDAWYAVLGSGIANQGGAVLLYRSPNLRNWEYLHILAGRNRQGASAFDAIDPWEVWECPEFFALGDWHVLIYSTAGRSHWQSGKLNTETMQFTPLRSGILDFGSYYAAKTQQDASGNRILWGWVQETRPLEEYKAAGWAGLMSLPRVLSVTQDGDLRVNFAPPLETLRAETESVKLAANEDENKQRIESIRLKNCCGELLLKARRADAPFQFIVSSAADRTTPWLTLEYEPAGAGRISIGGRPIPVLPEEEGISIHLYIDGSVIEVLVNGQAAWTKRFYFHGDRAIDAGLQWKGNTASIESLTVWQLNPISENRLT